MDGLEFKIMKLKKQEEEELAALKEKRLRLEDDMKKENERRATEKVLSALRKEKYALEESLEKVKQRSFALKIENDSWESTRRKNMEDLKNAEKMLNERHEKIWKNREFFCEETEKYIEEYGLTSKWWKEKMNIISDPHLLMSCKLKKDQAKLEKEKREKIISNLKNEIVELRNQIEEEEKEKLNNDGLIKELESEKVRLMKEVNAGEFLRLHEKILSVNSRCSELTKLIKEKETQNPTEFETDDLIFDEFEMDERKRDEETVAADFYSEEKLEPPAQSESSYFSEAKKNSRSDCFSSKKSEMPVTNKKAELSSKSNFSSSKKIETAAKSKKAEEIPKPDSFLYQMLDTKTVKAAKANAAKTRKLSSMTAQERARQLQLSFNNFLSQLQD